MTEAEEYANTLVRTGFHDQDEVLHQQDTERAAEGDGLYLSYGALEGGDTESIGHEVVAALTAANLPTEWNGTAAQRILVTPLNWQLRLE